MRESRSNHTKEGFVYLNVMSAAEEPHDPGNSIPQPPAQERGAGIGRKSGNDTEVAEQDEPNLRHPTNSHPSESELEMSAHENTKSAFVIMSVSAFDATEDLEQSKGMSHEADSFIEDKHRGQSESSESDEMMRGTLVAPLPDKEQISEFNERGLPIEGAANGPVAAPIPRRFRRVNKYERGRWVIEDALEHGETDERPESEMRGAYTNQNSSSSKGSTGNVVLGRESPYSQRKKGGEGGGGGGGGGDDLVHLHSRSSSDVGGQGLDSGGTGDNCHADRGSVVGGETTSNLSRNTSMSSLTTAGDKSVDGDHSSDRLSQLKDESESEITYPQTHTSAGHVTQSAVSSPLQQHRHSEASTGTSAVPTATNPTGTSASDSVGEENQSDSRSRTGVHRVEEALSHLNTELQRLVDENKEITRLKEANRHLDEMNRELQGEKRKLEDERRELRAQNSNLIAQITNLRRHVDDLTRKNEQLSTRLRNSLQPESGDS